MTTLLVVLGASWCSNALFLLLVMLMAHQRRALATLTAVVSGTVFVLVIDRAVTSGSLTTAVAYGLGYGLATVTAFALDSRLEGWITR